MMHACSTVSANRCSSTPPASLEICYSHIQFYPQVGQSVNAKYSDGKFYSAFVTSNNNNGTYNVYFLDDAKEFDNVPHESIKVPLVKGGKASCDVTSYVGKIFFDEGDDDFSGVPFEPGTFEVMGVGENNNYLCKRVGSEEGEEEFDMGYVIRRVRIYESE